MTVLNPKTPNKLNFRMSMHADFNEQVSIQQTDGSLLRFDGYTGSIFDTSIDMPILPAVVNLTIGDSPDIVAQKVAVALNNSYTFATAVPQGDDTGELVLTYTWCYPRSVFPQGSQSGITWATQILTPGKIESTILIERPGSVLIGYKPIRCPVTTYPQQQIDQLTFTGNATATRITLGGVNYNSPIFNLRETERSKPFLSKPLDITSSGDPRFGTIMINAGDIPDSIRTRRVLIDCIGCNVTTGYFESLFTGFIDLI